MRVAESALPAPFAGWFAARGWAPHPHQLEMLAAARDSVSALLIAPTGGGKTLAGFLPSLIELTGAEGAGGEAGLHTLYISPLKALAVDIDRNLAAPIAEMGLAVRSETRTGDTPASKRQRQRRRPPHMLLTTPTLVFVNTRAQAELVFRELWRANNDLLDEAAQSLVEDAMAAGEEQRALL